MDIERINSYVDARFPPEVLRQHGAFLADGAPWAFRGIYHVEDMAVYDHWEQEEKWIDWCQAYFSRK